MPHRDVAVRHDLSVWDIATGMLRAGKVTLTTYHATKGRKWPVVIMAGPVDGIMPRRPWDKWSRTFAEPSPPDRAQHRRSFCFGLPRAKERYRHGHRHILGLEAGQVGPVTVGELERTEWAIAGVGWEWDE